LSWFQCLPVLAWKVPRPSKQAPKLDSASVCCYESSLARSRGHDAGLQNNENLGRLPGWHAFKTNNKNCEKYRSVDFPPPLGPSCDWLCWNYYSMALPQNKKKKSSEVFWKKIFMASNYHSNHLYFLKELKKVLLKKYDTQMVVRCNIETKLTAQCFRNTKCGHTLTWLN